MLAIDFNDENEILILLFDSAKVLQNVVEASLRCA